jgi:hypothetical protein
LFMNLICDAITALRLGKPQYCHTLLGAIVLRRPATHFSNHISWGTDKHVYTPAIPWRGSASPITSPTE